MAVILPIAPQLAGTVVNVTVGVKFLVIVTVVSALHSPLAPADVIRYMVVA